MRRVSALTRRTNDVRFVIVLPALHLAVAAALVGAIVVGWLPPVYGLLAVGMLVVPIFWALRERVHEIALVFTVVFAGLTALTSPAPQLTPHGDLPGWFFESSSYDERLPAVIHVVFDEMMSPGAIDESLPGGLSTRQALYALGARFGLRTYDSVYSRAFFTNDSLTNLFNGEWSGRTGLPDRMRGVQALARNAYFDAMDKRGYRTVVFQTSLLDFCIHRSVDVCRTFASYDPSALDDADFSVRSRAEQLASTLLRAYEPSYISRYGRRLVSTNDDAPTDRDLGIEGRFDVQGFPQWFDRFVSFIGRVRRGTHVFAHFVVPHGPYVLSEDCGVGAPAGPGYYLGRRYRDVTSRTAARREYFDRYFAQVNCVRSRMGAFLEAVDSNPSLRDARIIVHGDHGSRISVGNVVEEYDTEDYIANYGAYFAVRTPGVTPGIDCEFASLADVFRRHAAGDTRIAPLDRSDPPVVVATKSGRSNIEVPMPRFGCAAQAPDAPSAHIASRQHDGLLNARSESRAP
jgi:hypothetical protein